MGRWRPSSDTPGGPHLLARSPDQRYGGASYAPPRSMTSLCCKPSGGCTARWRHAWPTSRIVAIRWILLVHSFLDLYPLVRLFRCGITQQTSHTAPGACIGFSPFSSVSSPLLLGRLAPASLRTPLWKRHALEWVARRSTFWELEQTSSRSSSRHAFPRAILDATALANADRA
jgi:hypothetical protein